MACGDEGAVTRRAGRHPGRDRARPRRAAAPFRTNRDRTLHVIVTAGPTREYIDPVRYLSNESSGRMGFELARAAVSAGHRVTLIAGPVDLPTPAGVERVDVVSALDMLASLEAHFPAADALFMAAAVGDFRPRHAPRRQVEEEGRQRRGPRARETPTCSRRSPGTRATAR